MGVALSRHGFVRRGGLAICLVAIITTPVTAQAPGPANPPAQQREGTIIGGKPTGTVRRCVDVQIGGDSAFGCLNEQLRREVDKVNPTLNLPPIDARSSDVRVGNANEAAIRQQYGSNYGRSATPFRPPAISNVLPHR
ncbi:hypothetical protein [Bradyrhizobium sp. BR13661]|jgi:hypothetical protein|uniref:hypothetical protein n=1 Tax=Bradyrhizobium sp. BR13661 TaxID=2940622 RepID=UPI002474C466|nr:hypothetical protein [Bradyrhizobium sp. BR13661]MDH6258153.1 hypothetical protein [Bradyrhizobium sp. BR13661]